ncbi:MAG: hypothetical protein KJZ75_14865 [Hyphomonadaceae bacterium]|nr:hypothetical protein [Hyphomonadaceae bacterium]
MQRLEKIARNERTQGGNETAFAGENGQRHDRRYDLGGFGMCLAVLNARAINARAINARAQHHVDAMGLAIFPREHRGARFLVNLATGEYFGGQFAERTGAGLQRAAAEFSVRERVSPIPRPAPGVGAYSQIALSSVRAEQDHILLGRT